MSDTSTKVAGAPSLPQHDTIGQQALRKWTTSQV
jgi:hypothetical protein